MIEPMNAEQILSLADKLRAHALDTGCDLNASNLFVHRMLMHAIRGDDAPDSADAELEEYDDV